jgi:hypothetical protein
MARSRHHHPCAGAALARRQADERAQGGLRRLRAVAPAGLSVAVAAGVSEVRIGLAAGGRWIRTFGSWSRNRKTDHGRRDCFLKNASESVGEPEVRIRFPPAVSQQRTASGLHRSETGHRVHRPARVGRDPQSPRRKGSREKSSLFSCRCRIARARRRAFCLRNQRRRCAFSVVEHLGRSRGRLGTIV